DLDEEIRATGARVQVPRCGDGARGVVRERGGDLERDPAIDTISSRMDRPEEIGGAGQVLDGELEEKLLTRETRRGLLADRRVVVVAVLDRVVEDRRVRGEPRDRQFPDVAGERPSGEEGARDVVEPEALARVVQLPGSFHRVPFRRAASSSAGMWSVVRIVTSSPAARPRGRPDSRPGRAPRCRETGPYRRRRGSRGGRPPAGAPRAGRRAAWRGRSRSSDYRCRR